jgi:uncharacterized membrane protein YgaE (UPF0421/DUF939 family)
MRVIRGSFSSGPFVPALVSRTQLLLAARVAVSAGVAWAVALAVDPNSRPYLAPLAVLLIVQPTVYDSLSRAFQRIVGVVLGVAAALAVSHFFAPSGWTIGIIIFAGLLLGWTVRLGPQGVVQVPVSALLVFAVGSAIPDYGGRRVVDTLIGSAIAVLAVLASPSAPAPERVVSDAVAPLRQCRDLLMEIGSSVSSPWTPQQTEVWRTEGLGLVQAAALARRTHEGHRLTARWNARARRQRPVLERADEALRIGTLVATQTRSIARALVDGTPDARPMPAVGALLVSTASSVEAYVSWVASSGERTDRQRLSDAIRVAGETLGRAVTRTQLGWRDEPSQWLSFGPILAMCHRILGEVGSPLESSDESA